MQFGDFRGPAVRLNDGDISALALENGIETAALKAIIAVESAGSGFDSKDRPKILFEPHIFFRQVSEDRRDEAITKGLAYRKWGSVPYPKGSDAQYARLLAAMDIDETAALKSASWGMGQIMGFNHRVVGADTVQDFVAANLDSEANQIRFMLKFIQNSGLLDEVRDLNWAAFAHGYNGPGYAANAYDVKLAAAYERFSAE
jgi:hypothetical protein